MWLLTQLRCSTGAALGAWSNAHDALGSSPTQGDGWVTRHLPLGRTALSSSWIDRWALRKRGTHDCTFGRGEGRAFVPRVPGSSDGNLLWRPQSCGRLLSRKTRRALARACLAEEPPTDGRRARRSASALSSTSLTPEPDSTPLVEDESMPLVAACLRAADERKAEQLTAIRVRHLTYVTSFFVFVTGLSRTQISAIARRIEERVESELSRKPMSTSFRGVNATPPGRSGWVTIDYGDVIVNIMSPEARSYYDIESLWSRGEAVDVDRVLGTALQTRVTGSVEADMAGATHQTMKDDAPVVEEDDEWDLEPGGEASFATDFAPLEDVFPAHAEGRTSPQTFSNDVDSEFDQHEKDPLGK